MIIAASNIMNLSQWLQPNQIKCVLDYSKRKLYGTAGLLQ